MDEMNLLGKNLERLMRERGDISAHALSKVAGVSASSIYNIFRQTGSPTLEMLVCIAQALRCEVYELLIPEDAAQLVSAYLAAHPKDQEYLFRFARSIRQGGIE